MSDFFKQLRQAFKAALATDKLLHASACFVLAVVFSLLLKKVDGGYFFAALLSIGVGVAKELYDRIRGGIFDGADIFADIVGAFCGGLACVILTV